MFKKVATLQFKKIYASDVNGNYYWRDFVKQANDKLATDANFVPKSFYEYDTKNFLYITARAISGMEKWGPNGNYDAFPWEELKRSYPTFCGKGFYIEHKEDDEKDAKGIILDAQPDDDNEFINCICAISKEEYPEICEDILNGKLNQVSMSCLAAECECSECHNVATKEEELCEHMNPEHPHFCKGSCNLQNKPIYEINRNIVFTGLSGVAVPADKDAFIFDVKASKKQNSKTINKEYNKYCRAKKEYEYINSLLEKEDTRKYIESKLNKKAFQDIKGESWDEVLDNIQKAGYDFDEHYYDEPYHFIKALKDNKEYEIELFGYHNGSYEVTGISDTGKTYKDFGDFIVNSNLKKKADDINQTETINKNIEEAKKCYNELKTKTKDELINMIPTPFGKEDKKYLQTKDEEYLIEKILRNKYNYPYYINISKEASLQKKASKFIIRDVESGMYFNNDNLVENKEDAKQYNTREEAENEVDRKMHKIIHKMQDKLKKLEPINSEDYYDVVQISTSLKKKADVEYFSDKVQEIPEIDFYTEFMNAGKSKGCNSDINKDQLELGIKVEMEHTTNPIIAEKIACDHIKEIPNYYTLLAEMEASAKASFEEAKHVVNKETNEEFPTKLASKQFFKIKKANNDLEIQKTYELLKQRIINKDKNIKQFNDAINKILNSKHNKYIYNLIENEIITPENDKELVNKTIDVLSNDDYKLPLYDLIKFRIIKKKDKEIFDKIVNNLIDVGNFSTNLLSDKLITKEDGDLFYKALANVKYDEHLYDLSYHNIITKEDIEKAKQFNKKSSKQFFKVNKASKKWFKIANIYDDPEERNNIDNYGLSELQRKEFQNVIDHIDIVNEDAVVTWDELIESVNQDILDYDFMNKNKVNIIDYIENELGQEIEVY